MRNRPHHNPQVVRKLRASHMYCVRTCSHICLAGESQATRRLHADVRKSHNGSQLSPVYLWCVTGVSQVCLRCIAGVSQVYFNLHTDGRHAGFIIMLCLPNSNASESDSIYSVSINIILKHLD